MNKKIESKIERVCISLKENIDEMSDNIKLLKKTVKLLPVKDNVIMVKQYNDILNSLIEFSKANLLEDMNCLYKEYVR
jgi:hypothetical protein